MNLTPEQLERLDACIQEIGEILYSQTDSSKLKDMEILESITRQHILDYIGPKLLFFFISQVTGTTHGKNRKLKTCLGTLTLTNKQAHIMGITSYARLSPLLLKCSLLVSAKASYGMGEKDIKILTGVQVSHSTLQRKVNESEFDLPSAKQPVSEVCIDGGKVRLRTPFQGAPCVWKDYKVGRMQGIYYGATFQDPQTLTDWINSQKTTNPLICLGDGHDGIWNLFKEISSPEQRQEILDWYHLKENLYKIKGSKKKLKKIESLLWKGQVMEAKSELKQYKSHQASKLGAYLTKHQGRIINYNEAQEEQICSIGSGAVESAVKQIDKRLKLAGAQWNSQNINKILGLRCAYLNGSLAV
ncbi:ISKra4 family transposase [Laspinema sp. D1]|uniref:ISKra4 family transposase n=1 Tax=Laspinema palackyanum TaxID=3231601 RepID=UPI00348C14BF|nr:ISKra4 family transposase [Laspinema sp. D2b]